MTALGQKQSLTSLAAQWLVSAMSGHTQEINTQQNLQKIVEFRCPFTRNSVFSFQGDRQICALIYR